jgi:hypothetical protein
LTNIQSLSKKSATDLIIAYSDAIAVRKTAHELIIEKASEIPLDANDALTEFKSEESISRPRIPAKSLRVLLILSPT